MKSAVRSLAVLTIGSSVRVPVGLMVLNAEQLRAVDLYHSFVL